MEINWKNKLLFGAVALIALVLIMGALLPKPKIIQPVARINQQIVHLEVADTQAKQVKGLSGRTDLAENTGMLFPYAQARNLSFWMRDMRFPIDIIWIKDQTVVGLTTNIPIPDSLPLEIYSSPEPVNFVLELNAGSAQKYNIQIGDSISLEY